MGEYATLCDNFLIVALAVPAAAGRPRLALRRAAPAAVEDEGVVGGVLAAGVRVAWQVQGVAAQTCSGKVRVVALHSSYEEAPANTADNLSKVMKSGFKNTGVRKFGGRWCPFNAYDM